MQRKCKIILILIFAYINIFDCAYFKYDNKWLHIIQEQSMDLDCIRVNISNLNESVFRFLLKVKIPVIISKVLNSQTSLCANSILQLDSVEHLKPIFDNHFDRSGIMFIIFNKKIDWHQIWTYCMYYWKKYKVYKVFYITPEHSKFYHPFIIRNDKFSYGDMVDAESYNRKDIFKNLYGYPVRIYIFDSVFSEVKAHQGLAKVTGVDAKVAQLLENVLNFTMQLQWPYENFFGARLENGSFNGALGRIIRDESDITMTGFFIKDYLTRDMHFSPSVYMDKLCCYVIKSKRISASILPLYAVNENVWIVYISVGFFSSLLWMLLRRFNLYIDIYSYTGSREYLKKSLFFQYLRVFLDTWILWARMILIRFPLHSSERIFAISLCLVSVIIGALLDSSLATVYIHPRYYKNINTLEELEKANLKIFIKHAAMRDDLFRGQNSRLYNKLDERVMLVGEPEERLISIMSKHGGFAVVTREFTLFLRDIYYFSTKKIHVIPECPKMYHIAYLYTKNSPYEETFNMALLQFLAAGLINQWIDISRHEAQCHIQKYSDIIDERSYQWKAFQINDIEFAMCVLIFGNICATLLFLAEIILRVYKNLIGKNYLAR